MGLRLGIDSVVDARRIAEQPVSATTAASLAGSAGNGYRTRHRDLQLRPHEAGAARPQEPEWPTVMRPAVCIDAGYGGMSSRS